MFKSRVSIDVKCACMFTVTVMYVWRKTSLVEKKLSEERYFGNVCLQSDDLLLLPQTLW